MKQVGIQVRGEMLLWKFNPALTDVELERALERLRNRSTNGSLAEIATRLGGQQFVHTCWEDLEKTEHIHLVAEILRE